MQTASSQYATHAKRLKVSIVPEVTISHMTLPLLISFYDVLKYTKYFSYSFFSFRANHTTSMSAKKTVINLDEKKRQSN